MLGRFVEDVSFTAADGSRLDVRSGHTGSTFAGASVGGSVSIDVDSLDDDGFPAQDRDERSAVCDDAGYRELFRRLVRTVNRMDLDVPDRGLADYLDLPRARSFDLSVAHERLLDLDRSESSLTRVESGMEAPV